MGQWFAEIFVERKRGMIGVWENLEIYLIRTASPVFAPALGCGEYSGVPRPESLASYAGEKTCCGVCGRVHRAFYWGVIVGYCHRENKVALGFVEDLNKKIWVLQ